MRLIIQLKRKEILNYPVVIENGLLKKIPEIVRAATWGEHVAIITDKKIQRLYGKELLFGFKKAKVKASLFAIPPGEKEKRLSAVEKLAEKMVVEGLKRDTLVIALGGGVVLDVAGFLASIYMRGVPHINIPTTLLAMADAAIGGKTGVDLKQGKNLIGAFHQPKAVYMDPDVLQSLSESEFKNGLAEIIKHGVIGDRGLIRLLEKKRDLIVRRDPKVLYKMLVRSCKVKQKIVEQDERENHRRMLLNYGHTIGHAIEHATNYAMSHGYAVSIGMALENRFFNKKKLVSHDMAERVHRALRAFDLPTELPEKLLPHNVQAAIGVDKKMRNGELQMILPTRIGKAKIYTLKNPKQLRW